MQEPATATEIGPDEQAALKHVALAGGLTETKVSCATLGDLLDASTQTASRRLQRLEGAELIERDVVGDGQWVRVTDDGEAALRAEYADYRRLFESDPAITLSGSVTGGMGEGRHYITLDGYMRQFRDRLGYEPFPGTLNVDLDEESVRRRGELGSVDAVRIDAWEDDERTYGAATCYAGTVVVDGEDAARREYDEAHVIVPDRTHHDESQIELIAPDRLRDVLELADGNRIDVEITPTDRGDA